MHTQTPYSTFIYVLLDFGSIDPHRAGDGAREWNRESIRTERTRGARAHEIAPRRKNRKKRRNTDRNNNRPENNRISLLDSSSCKNISYACVLAPHGEMSFGFIASSFFDVIICFSYGPWLYACVYVWWRSLFLSHSLCATLSNGTVFYGHIPKFLQNGAIKLNKE